MHFGIRPSRPAKILDLAMVYANKQLSVGIPSVFNSADRIWTDAKHGILPDIKILAEARHSNLTRSDPTAALPICDRLEAVFGAGMDRYYMCSLVSIDYHLVVASQIRA